VTVNAYYSPPKYGQTTCDAYTVGSGGRPLDAQPSIALIHEFEGSAGGESAYYQFAYLTIDAAFDPAKTYLLSLTTSYGQSAVTIGVAGVAANNAPNYTEWHWGGPGSPVPAFCVHPDSGTQTYGFPFPGAKSANGTALLRTLAKSAYIDVTELLRSFKTLVVVALGPSEGNQNAVIHPVISTTTKESAASITSRSVEP